MCPVFIPWGNCPASVSHFQHFSQTGSHNVQTPHNYNVPSVFGVGKNGSANVFQLQNVSQSGSHSVQTHQNVPSVYSVWQNIPASVSQAGSQSVQTPHNLPCVYGVEQNYITSAAQPQNVFQPQLPQS